MSETPPVLFIVFNRPDPTTRVFDAIRRAAPARLYVAADGPRPSRPDDAKLCEQVRAIATKVDWPCELHTRLLDQNLGCRKAVSTAITWFFEQEEAGIILEDDCLPDPSFFPYCAHFLERHRNDAKVMAVTGTCFASPRRRSQQYHYGYLPHVWGWATWRRAWDKYDVAMPDWPAERWVLDKLFPKDPHIRQHFAAAFDRTGSGAIDTWDYQWTWRVMREGGLVVTPHVNMVSNIGFGADATHTSGYDPLLADLPIASFPLGDIRPIPVRRDRYHDANMDRVRFGPRRSVARRALGRLARWLGR